MGSLGVEHSNDGLGAPVVQSGVKTRVKWYSPSKGFGFVQPADGSFDAFLHVSVVQQSGATVLPEGTTIVCDLTEGQKGMPVAAIQEIDTSTAVPAEDGGDEVTGTVKFFNGQKGFGFVTVDGGRDVFISARVMERCGIPTLEPDTRVRMWTKMGPKGPMASKLELL